MFVLCMCGVHVCLCVHAYLFCELAVYQLRDDYVVMIFRTLLVDFYDPVATQLQFSLTFTNTI